MRRSRSIRSGARQWSRNAIVRAVRRSDPVEEIVSAIGALGGLYVTVAIDGPSGAGKSTVASLVRGRLGSDAAVVVGDDFYADIDWSFRGELTPAEAYKRNYDWRRLADQILVPARSGAGRLRYQRYDWDRERPGGWVEVSTPSVVIVEGIYLLRPELRDLFDLRVWVDAPRDLRISRQRRRHAHYSAPTREKQNAQLVAWLAAEDHYIATAEPVACAHITVDGAASSIAM